MPSRQASRERILAVSTVAVIIGVGVGILIIEPQLKERKARVVQLRELKVQLMKAKADLQVKARIEEAYSRIEPLMSGTGGDQQEISTFTRELSALYAGLGVKTKSMRILPTNRASNHRLLSIRIEVEGPVREMIRFILSVESCTQPLRIEQLTLRAQEIVDSVSGSLLITKAVAQAET